MEKKKCEMFWVECYLVGTSIYCPYRASVTLAFSCGSEKKPTKRRVKILLWAGSEDTLLALAASYRSWMRFPSLCEWLLAREKQYGCGNSKVVIVDLSKVTLLSFSLWFFEPKREREKKNTKLDRLVGCMLVLFFSWLFGKLQCLGDWKELEKCASVFGLVCFLLGVASWKKGKEVE
jgi:hypothetical protein